MEQMGTVGRQVSDLQAHVAALQREARSAGGSPLAEAAIEVLYAAMEELRVGGEELRARNEELDAAARALEVERARYQQLFDGAPDAYLFTDDAGVIDEMNEAAGRLLGIAVQNAIGKSLATFVPQEGRRAFRRKLSERIEKGMEGDWELALRRRGGEAVAVVCRVGRAPSGSGPGPALFWIIRDVSERRLSEEREHELEREHARAEASEEARAQLDAIIRHLPIAVFIAEAPSGRFLTYNDAAEQLFRFPPPLADAAEEYSELYRGFHPDGRPLSTEEWPLVRAIRGGEVVRGEEIEFLLPDGARRVFRASAAPVRDAEGRVIAGVAGLFDVTDVRRQARDHRLLANVSDALSASLDYAETAQRIAELCVEGEVADYAAVYVQEEDGDLQGLGFAASGGDADGAPEPLRRRIPAGAGLEHPVLAVLRTGEPRLIGEMQESVLRELARGDDRLERTGPPRIRSALAVPLLAGGRTLGVITLERGASSPPFAESDLPLAQELASRAAHAVDNARLYLDAQRSARTQEETISVVSHDLRNALNAALMNADLLLDIRPAFEPESRPRRQMEALRRSLDHMYRLVQDLLEVDRLDRRRLSVHLETIALETLVEEIRGLLAALARNAGVDWEVVAPSEGAVQADYARLVQVLSNLIGNAVKATPPGGRITVRVEDSPGEVRFHVSDTGGGIGAEHLPRIFDRFFQVPERGKGGSGLGLTIARGIVEAHGGRIWAESRAGEGSTFSFAIPRPA